MRDVPYLQGSRIHNLKASLFKKSPRTLFETVTVSWRHCENRICIKNTVPPILDLKLRSVGGLGCTGNVSLGDVRRRTPCTYD
jgi:hypothetical protein